MNPLFKMVSRENSIATVEEGDYYKNDLLYCGKCHKPKERLIKSQFYGDFKVRDRCDCDLKREAEEADKTRLSEEERQKQARARLAEQRRDRAFPDRRMKEWRFEVDDKTNAKLSEVAQKYVDAFDAMRERGTGLLLYGGVGTGKTFISACIVNALIDRGFRCKMTNFARLSNTLIGMLDGKQEYIDQLNNCDLLVIDDLASERDTEYMGEVVQMVIDSRYNAGLPLIVTTNLTAEQLKHPQDIRRERIYSRLFEMCVPFEVKGSDRRKRKARDANADMRELLGL